MKTDRFNRMSELATNSWFTWKKMKNTCDLGLEVFNFTDKQHSNENCDEH